MARTKETTNKRPVEQYDHKRKQRVNNPPTGLVDAKSDAVEGRKTYAYDPHLDPTLVWAGKAERTSFEIPTVSQHVHERIDPRSIIEAVRKKNGSGGVAGKRANKEIRPEIRLHKPAVSTSRICRPTNSPPVS